MIACGARVVQDYTYKDGSGADHAMMHCFVISSLLKVYAYLDLDVLMFLRKTVSHSITPLLKEGGASVLPHDRLHHTALHHLCGVKVPAMEACMKWNMIRELVEKGAPVNALSAAGESPLHIACRSRPAADEVIRDLLNWGCLPNVVSVHGQTPYMLATPGLRKRFSEFCDRGYCGWDGAGPPQSYLKKASNSSIDPLPTTLALVQHELPELSTAGEMKVRVQGVAAAVTIMQPAGHSTILLARTVQPPTPVPTASTQSAATAVKQEGAGKAENPPHTVVNDSPAEDGKKELATEIHGSKRQRCEPPVSMRTAQ